MTDICPLSITFAEGATDCFVDLARQIETYDVRVTPADGSAPFDAVLLGKPSISEWLDEFVFALWDNDVRGQESNERRTCRVSNLHVY